VNRSSAAFAVLVASTLCAAGLSGCGRSHASPTTTGTSAPRAAVYRVGTTAVRIAFPGVPRIGRDPASLVPVMPAHTSVTVWNIGDVGALQDNSYELVLASFPAGSTTTTIDDFLATYAKAPNAKMFGVPALREVNTIPFATGTRYSGITAFNVGLVLVMAVAFDSVRADVVRFLDSLQLQSRGN